MFCRELPAFLISMNLSGLRRLEQTSTRHASHSPVARRRGATQDLMERMMYASCALLKIAAYVHDLPPHPRREAARTKLKILRRSGVLLISSSGLARKIFSELL